MAPTNEVAVNRQYHNAVHSLQVACIDLVRHLPPPDNQEEGDDALEAPPPWLPSLLSRFQQRARQRLERVRGIHGSLVGYLLFCRVFCNANDGGTR